LSGVLFNIKSVDPVEVSADAVHYLTARWALGSGCECPVSGDGGNEVFLGYTFLEGLSLEELLEWRRAVLEEAWLPTVHVGALLGVRVVAPLYSREARDLARSTPLNCMVRRGLGGKLLVRLYIDTLGLRGVAWRPKTPVTSGSGFLEKLKALAEKAPIGEEGLREVENALGFKPPTRLHAFLAYRMEQLGIKPPEVVPGGCPVCGRRLHRRTCRFCGTYIAREGVTLHYQGD